MQAAAHGENASRSVVITGAAGGIGSALVRRFLMRGYGDSDKPVGTDGHDASALAEEFRALVRQIGFGSGQPLLLAAHDLGAPPALLRAADAGCGHFLPEEHPEIVRRHVQALRADPQPMNNPPAAKS